MAKVLGATLALFVAAAYAGSQPSSFYFDMGTADSPLKGGYQRVTAETVYSAERGFGWDRPLQADFDDVKEVAAEFRATHPNYARPVDDPVLRDGVEDDRPVTFVVDVPPAKYWASVVLGRYAHPRHDMRVTLNGDLIAENVDTWGEVWGSQGGTPTKSVAVIAEPVNGQFRFTFEYVHPSPGRWREYTTQEPEGGRLWYLGENRNSILAIRIRPQVALPMRVEEGQLIRDVDDPRLQAAIAAFNAGNMAEAVAKVPLSDLDTPEALARKGCLLDWITGSMLVEDRAREIELMDLSIGAWSAALEQLEATGRTDDPLAVLARARIESAQRYRQALAYINMYNYAWANERTRVNCYHRYWAAYDLCGPFTPDDPLYFKSHLVRGRVSYWNGREGGWKHCYDLAKSHFAVLKRAFPDNPLVKIYSGEKVTARKRYEADAPNAPEWAQLQHEALARYMDLIHYWVLNRQAYNGELGGGWGDDVEILRGWAPAVLAVSDPIALRGLAKLAEGVWNSDAVASGYSRYLGDVEHAAEPVSDTQPLMCAADYGNPVYIERCMATMACMRDVWTAVNDYGHRHFKGHYYSATEVSTEEPRTADVALNGRAAKPGIWVAWYNGHPAVKDLLGEWCMAWIEDAFRTDNGKPKGFVPGSVRFEDDRLGGFGEHWWETPGYFADFEAVWYTSTLYHHMLAMYALTGDDTYMSALHATLGAVIEEQANLTDNPQKGSRAWAAKVCDSDALVNVFEKWRVLTGDSRYDDYLLERGSPYLRYLLTRDLQPLVASLQEVIDALSANIEMSTSEVLFTDRVSLPGSQILFQMMTGAVGNPTYYPMHAVTWEHAANNLAVLVEEARPDMLVALVYRFGAGEKLVILRSWRLEPAIYSLHTTALPPVRSDFVPMDCVAPIPERGHRIKLALAAGQLVRIQLRRAGALTKSTGPLPDLALGPDAIELIGPPPETGKAIRVRVTVHNVGTATATDIRGELDDGEAPAAAFTLADLPAPLDLEPKLLSAEVEWTPATPGARTLRVRVDPEDTIPEIVELNNTRCVTVAVR